MKKYTVISFALVALFSLSAFAQTNEKSNLDKAWAGKIVQWLESGDYAYAKAKDNVWTAAFKGNQIPEFNIIVIGHDNLLILLGVVAEKKDYKLTPELMQKLLGLNDDMDRVKIAIDDDGDIIARIDMSLRVIDTEEFKVNIEQIAAATDEAHAAIKQFLLNPKKTEK
jgi:hypothetical protein